jgi:broad specificity phosphatase PhoE
MKESYPTTIFLVRHGQSEFNAQRRISGQLDTPLSRQGFQQSLVLADRLAGECLTAIYASPLTRSIETARPTADRHGLPIHLKEDLKERHFGILQGRYRDERDPEAQRMWKERKRHGLDDHVPGGETVGQLKHRVLACLREILDRNVEGAVLLVGHRGPNRIILGTLLGWPEDRWGGITPRSKYLYRISLGASPMITTLSLTQANEVRTYDGLLL